VLNDGDLEKTMIEIRNRRKEMHGIGKETYIIKSEKKDDGNEKNKETSGNIVSDIDKGLIELKGNEPTSDNQFFRMSIIGYELGDLHRAIVYATRFKDDKKMRTAHLANGKLAMADLLTQLYLLCSTLEWDFNTLRKLGLDHLRERHGDFRRDGWSEIK